MGSTVAGEARAGDSRAARSNVEQPARGDGFGTYNDEAASRLLDEKVAEGLAREIQERDAEARRLEAEVEIARARSAAIQYRHDVYGQRAYRYDAPYDRVSMPWNTLFYGGLGAVIGHQYGRRDRGLAIGASIGLLQDVMRWRW